MTDPLPRESVSLRRTEVAVGYLIERYNRLLDEVRTLRKENQQLAQQLDEVQHHTEALEQKLALTAGRSISALDPDAQRSAESLYSEICDLVSTVDDALTLLDRRVK